MENHPQYTRAMLEWVQPVSLTLTVSQENERNRRVADLARVASTTAGAACTFARRALAAIQQANGDVAKVDWEQVERVAADEAINEHKQSKNSVLVALSQHSPGMVDPDRMAPAQEAVHITHNVRRQAWDRLRRICFDLDCRVPTLEDINEMKSLSIAEFGLPNSALVLCSDRISGERVFINFDIGYRTTMFQQS